MSQALNETVILSWTEKTSVGSSREAYFGALSAGDQVIYVRLVSNIDQPNKWEIVWNVGCHPVRKAENPFHDDLYKAIEEAEREVGRLLANPVPVCKACNLMISAGARCAIQTASQAIHGA